METQQVNSILSFSINKEVFAFDTLKVRHILEITPITKVPNTKEYFEGVINLHGNIIPVVDLRKMMGMVEPKNTQDSAIIVVSDSDEAGSQIGMIVDSLKEVFTVDQANLKETIIEGHAENSIIQSFVGTVKINEDFIHIINLDDLVVEIEQ
jgi:purine-binding chemotaxis protein CheW